MFLIGCGETPKEKATDVADAGKEVDESVAKARSSTDAVRTKANESVADAAQTYARSDAITQSMLGAAATEAMSRKARAGFVLPMTTAKGTHKVAAQECEALGGADLKACGTTADAVLATAIADAPAKRDVTLVAAEYYK